MTEGQVVDDAPVSGAPPPRRGGPPTDVRRETSDTDAPESRLGTTLAGRYRLERVIAKGGMGRVYLATQLPLERQVAIKLLVNQRFDAEFRQRFFLEASTCARLVHRHIVTVHDYGEAENGELFMAMEYLDGIPLSKLIQKQVRLPSERACKIALQVCRALRTAHKTGVVHRDLKPGNVIVLTDEDQDGNDFIKVLDFGLVKAFQQDTGTLTDLTKSGTWLGSPRYMAPEQIRCQPVDPRTDIYSLGVILFHMLAGRPPFIGSNSMEVLEQHLRDKPPSIADVLGRSDYAPELEVIVERCLKKDAAQRYQSMDELIGDLKAAYRLITGVSLHTESTLPTFAEIADPSLAVSPPTVTPTGSVGRPLPQDTMALHDASSVNVARVTGTIRTPLEMLEASNPSGIQDMVVPHLDEPFDPQAVSVIEDGSLIVRPRALRWVGVAALLVLVLVAGFLSVRAFAPKPVATVKVRFDSRPQGAEVFLDGRLLGVTPMKYNATDYEPGSMKTFVVRKTGYQEYKLNKRIEGEEVDLHAALVPVPVPPPRIKSPPPPVDRSQRSERSERRRRDSDVERSDRRGSSADSDRSSRRRGSAERDRGSRRDRDTDRGRAEDRRRRRTESTRIERAKPPRPVDDGTETRLEDETARTKKPQLHIVDDEPLPIVD